MRNIWIILPMVCLTWACGTDEAADPQAVAEVIIERGPQGERGEDGKDGSNGTDGVDGEDGQTVTNEIRPVVPDTWLDPVEDRLWVIGGEVNATNVVCNGGFEVPDVSDFNEARTNGLTVLLEDIGAATYMWLKNLSDGVVESYRDLHDGSTTNSMVGGSLFCVEI